MHTFKQIGIFVFLFISLAGFGQHDNLKLVPSEQIVTGAQNTEAYLPLLQDNKVAIVANHASIIGETHLVDSLKSLGINIVKIFSPEHGFRGNADAGEKVENNVDSATSLPVISLYGDHKKPGAEDLSGIEVVVFDLQDVGVRFFTYISTLTYVMEACAENNIPLIVLDRPNPNSFYIDGPVLQPEFKSFVGLHPVPVVYGMTIGEYAQMVNGEGWLENEARCDLTIIPLQAYYHEMIVDLPVKPSPNLPNWQAIYLYPSLCFFEGTVMSVGRGTDLPFQVYGHPAFAVGSFVFIPESNEGARHPKYEGQQCYGAKVLRYARKYYENPQRLALNYLHDAYRFMKFQGDFFNDYFDTLAGTDELRKQIEAGMTLSESRASWQDDLEVFKNIRAKYLIYN